MKASIQFKNYSDSDFHDFEKTLEKVWSYREYTDNEMIRQAFIKTDVYMSLYESDYKDVVYVNGEFAGIALARISRVKPLIQNMKYYFKFLRYAFKLKFHSRESRKLLKNFKRMYKAYKKLLKQKDRHIKSELVLFMVDPSYQRMGLGKELIKRFEETLHKKKKGHYYLFTDSQCTFSFYEASGFLKQGETSMVEPLKNGERNLTIMLFAKDIQKVKQS